MLLVVACLLLLLTSFALAQEKPAPAFKVGVTYRGFTPKEPYNWRGATTHALRTAIWYPAEASTAEQPIVMGPANSQIFIIGNAAQDAHLAASPAKLPLIVLSQGPEDLLCCWAGLAPLWRRMATSSRR